LDIHELAAVFSDLGEKLSSQELKSTMKDMDEDCDGTVSFEEFMHGVYDYVIKSENLSQKREELEPHGFEGELEDFNMKIESEKEEEEDMPADLHHLSPDEQQKRIKYRAAFMLHPLFLRQTLKNVKLWLSQNK
jgi:hypothetical protein